ncbi:hypothetical protein AtDm6_3622 [Acetobacter tropicalis]|uniref:Uncharacterized protein n=1 Tax=Acetobacter tropicalis TaxID=104102 RepID=A0A094YF13_9PROT|nr:hypothetical protein AtDm6_3622 [Acetobacter tropicalis]
MVLWKCLNGLLFKYGIARQFLRGGESSFPSHQACAWAEKVEHFWQAR